MVHTKRNWYVPGKIVHMKNISQILLLGLFLMSCADKSESILYVNSYHQGYASSDSIMAGMEEVLEGRNINLNTFYLDSKRNPELSQISLVVNEILNSIEILQPDVILVSDDNAVKYLVQPHLEGSEIPVLFCGVNWSASQYGLPTKNCTGMLEVLPLGQLLNVIKSNYPQAKRLTVLSENTLSERNNKTLLDTLYHSHGFADVTYSLVDNFEDWKDAFRNANDSSDVIYIPTNGGVKNWNQEEAVNFVLETCRIPVVTCDDFMMPYAVFGLTKVASEQGEWMADRAMEILNGRSVASIELTRNQKVNCWINSELAEKISFELPANFAECRSNN